MGKKNIKIKIKATEIKEYSGRYKYSSSLYGKRIFKGATHYIEYSVFVPVSYFEGGVFDKKKLPMGVIELPIREFYKVDGVVGGAVGEFLVGSVRKWGYWKGWDGCKWYSSREALWRGVMVDIYKRERWNHNRGHGWWIDFRCEAPIELYNGASEFEEDCRRALQSFLTYLSKARDEILPNEESEEGLEGSSGGDSQESPQESQKNPQVSDEGAEENADRSPQNPSEEDSDPEQSGSEFESEVEEGESRGVDSESSLEASSGSPESLGDQDSKNQDARKHLDFESSGSGSNTTSEGSQGKGSKAEASPCIPPVPMDGKTDHSLNVANSNIENYGQESEATPLEGCQVTSKGLLDNEAGYLPPHGEGLGNPEQGVVNTLEEGLPNTLHEEPVKVGNVEDGEPGPSSTSKKSTSEWLQEIKENPVEATHSYGGGGGQAKELTAKDSHHDIEKRAKELLQKLFSSLEDIFKKDFPGYHKWYAREVIISSIASPHKLPSSKYDNPQARKLSLWVDVSGSVSHLSSFIISIITAAAKDKEVEVVVGSEAHPQRVLDQKDFLRIGDGGWWSCKGLWEMEYIREFSHQVEVYLKNRRLPDGSTIVIWSDYMDINASNLSKLERLLRPYNIVWLCSHSPEFDKNYSGNESFKLEKFAKKNGHLFLWGIDSLKGIKRAIREINIKKGGIK